MKYPFTIWEYISMPSTNTTITESSILENILFMVSMNEAGALVSPMGIATHSYRMNLITNMVFGVSSSAIWHCQYPPSRPIDMKYFILPSNSENLHVVAKCKCLLL